MDDFNSPSEYSQRNCFVEPFVEQVMEEFKDPALAEPLLRKIGERIVDNRTSYVTELSKFIPLEEELDHHFDAILEIVGQYDDEIAALKAIQNLYDQRVIGMEDAETLKNKHMNHMGDKKWNTRVLDRIMQIQFAHDNRKDGYTPSGNRGIGNGNLRGHPI